MAEPAATKATVVAPRKRKALRAYLVLAALAVIALAAYFIRGYLTRDVVSTDDAQIEADVVPIAAQVGGMVLRTRVEDNQPVAANAVIAEIDPAVYNFEVAEAQAELDSALSMAQQAEDQVEIVRSSSAGGLSSAKAQLAGTGASVRSAAAQVQGAEAALARTRTELKKADDDLARARKLHDAGAVSGQALEAAQAARDSAATAVDGAQANLAAARDQQAVSESRVAEAAGRVQQSTPVERQIAVASDAAKLARDRVGKAQAALDLAKVKLGYTKILSPVAGAASKLAIHTGQTVQPGTVAVMIVPTTRYVIANFKETQIARIQPGDAAEVSVDALDGKMFRGKVASLSPATGARFSMIPPDNATGNFVKVVQRVPVKIVLDDGQDLAGLHAGLSVEVKVHLQ
jgi:membrane fusion protein (multidrug efflux system)